MKPKIITPKYNSDDAISLFFSSSPFQGTWQRTMDRINAGLSRRVIYRTYHEDPYQQKQHDYNVTWKLPEGVNVDEIPTEGYYIATTDTPFPAKHNNIFNLQPVRIIAMGNPAGNTLPDVFPELYNIRSVEPMTVTVPVDYPDLKKYLGGKVHNNINRWGNYFNGFGRTLCIMDFTDAVFDTSVPGTFQVVGKWAKLHSYNILPANAEQFPPVYTIVVAEDVERMNINTASQTELQEINGVGEVLAGRIVECRTFANAADLTRVSGIGDVTSKRIGGQVSF